MTREELKIATNDELIDELDYCGYDSYYRDYRDDVAAEIKKRMQEPCEDTVSRKEVIKILQSLLDRSMIDFFTDKVNNLPPVTPTRKKGKWIEEPNCWLRCSCCKSHYPHTSINGVMGSKYCPNCGSEMESEE